MLEVHVLDQGDVMYINMYFEYWQQYSVWKYGHDMIKKKEIKMAYLCGIQMKTWSSLCVEVMMDSWVELCLTETLEHAIKWIILYVSQEFFDRVWEDTRFTKTKSEDGIQFSQHTKQKKNTPCGIKQSRGMERFINYTLWTNPLLLGFIDVI
jgi:hypothetical protein